MKKETKLILGFTILLAIGAFRFKDINQLSIRIENSEKLDIKDEILEDIVKAYINNQYVKKENIAAACGYFFKALKTGSISVTNRYSYNRDKKEEYQYISENDYNCLLGYGVCRDENVLISKLLNLAGFDTVPLVSSLNGEGHSYILIYDDSINKKYIYDYTNNCFWKINNFDDIKAVSNIDVNSNVNLALTYFGFCNFDLDDLIKINIYDNNEDFEQIINDYKIGQIAFGQNDIDYINELTYDKKQKIKKIENL